MGALPTVGDGVAPTPSVGVRVAGEVTVRVAVAAGLVGVDIAMVLLRVGSGERVNAAVGTEDTVNVAVGATGMVLVRVGSGWVKVRVGVGGAVNVAVGAGMVLVGVGTGWVNVGVGGTVNVPVGVGGRRTVRYSGAETASGPGFATLMTTEPCVVAVPVAVSRVGELKMVDSGVLFQRTCTPVTNELPVTRRVNGPISN